MRKFLSKSWSDLRIKYYLPGAHGINPAKSLRETVWVDVDCNDGQLILVHQEWGNAAYNSHFC
jgi:hypothetical protein